MPAIPGHGIVQLVVGTGGIGLNPFGTVRANSAVRNATTYGVMKLTLRPGSWDSQFVPVAGGTFTDVSGGACHDAP